MAPRLPHVLAATLCLVGVAAAQPNILHIVADDLGWTDLSTGLTNYGAGSAFYETPNIDRLATEGMAFTSAYAAATCVPTRAAMLTGQYATRTGVYTVASFDDDANDPLVSASNNRVIDPAAITVGETLQGAGYTTAHVGKFHTTQTTAQITTDHGYDFDFGGGTSGGPGSYFATGAGVFGNSIGPGLDPYAAPYTQAYVDEHLAPYANGADVDSLVGTNKHLTDAMADAAIDFMQNQLATSSEPFYINFAFNAVHNPIEPRPDLAAKYDAILASNGGVSPDPRHGNAPYAGLLEGMDQAIGRVLGFLEDPDGDGDASDSIAGNTVVLFYGDNGGTSQSTSSAPLSGSKGSLQEGGVRVPLIAWSPGTIPAGSSTDEPVFAVDFYPTFADLAGASLPSASQHPLDGESLTGLLTGQTTETRRDGVFYHFPGYVGQNSPRSMAVYKTNVGRRKVFYDYEDRSYEVFDLDADIGETNDLANGDMAPQEYRAAVRAAVGLRAWLDETGADYPTVRADGSPVPAPEFLPSISFQPDASADGQSGVAIDKLGVTATLTASGQDATLTADVDGVGVSSSLDTGGAAQQDRVNGALATPEAIELSFDQDVALRSLSLDDLNTSQPEAVVLSFVSGDNPFAGLQGYDDEFTVGTDSLMFAASDAGASEFTLEFGVVGRDELFLTAGTVLSLTADPAFGGGLTLSALTVARPMSAAAQILADYNLDGVVDAADHALWLATYGSTTDLRADGNGDGVVDAVDFTVWREAAQSPSTAVPEPTGWLLACLGLGLTRSGTRVGSPRATSSSV